MKDELKNTIENLKAIINNLGNEKAKLIKQAIEQGIAKIDNEYNPFADSESPSTHDLVWNLSKEDVEKGGVYSIQEDIKKIDAHLDLLWKTDSLIRNLYTAEIMDLSFITPLDQKASNQ